MQYNDPELITLFNSMKSLTENTLVALNDELKKHNEFNKWHFDSLYDTHANLRMASGETYKDGSPKYLSIEIKHGYSFSDKTDYKFTINPFSCGSIDIMGDNCYKEYFMATGAVFSNVEFHTAIRSILFNYDQSRIEIVKKIRDIERIYEKAEHEKREAEMIASAYTKCDEIIAAKEKNTDLYVVIDKGDECVIFSGMPDAIKHIYTYRNKAVKIMAGPISYNEAYKEMKSYYKSDYHKYQVIEISKLKINM